MDRKSNRSEQGEGGKGPPPGPFRIARAQGPAGIEIARGLFREYAEGLGFDLCFQDFEKELAELPGAYAPPRGALFLAWAGREPAGCVALRPLNAETAEMKRLYLRPARRGTGLGARLAEAAIAEASRLGYALLRLDTLPDMTAARALYARLGFREIPPYTDNPIPGARYLELRLEAASGGSEEDAP